MKNGNPRSLRVALLATVAGLSLIPAGPAKPTARVDDLGDPLPPAAVARLGTGRFRHGGRVDALAYTPDGRTIASGGAGRFVLWEAATGRPVATFVTTGGDRPPGLPIPLPDVYALRFTPDGRSLVAIAASPVAHTPTYLLRWDVAGRRLAAATECPALATLSPDGTALAAAADAGPETLTDTITGKSVPTTVRLAYDRLFSPDGKTLALLTGDEVALVAPATGVVRRRVAIDRVAGAAAFAADGRSLWVGLGRDDATPGQPERGAVYRVSLATGAVVQKFATAPGEAAVLAPAPDGRTLASGGEEAGPVLWDAAMGTGTDLAPAPPRLRPSVRALAYAPDGQTLAAGDNHGRVRVWDVGTRRELHRRNTHTREVLQVAVSPDQLVVATAGRDGTVRTWDLATGRPAQVWAADERGAVAALRYTPDGRSLVTAGADGGVRVWDAATGAAVRRLAAAPGSGRVSLSADGRAAAVSGGEDGFAALCDVAAGRSVRTFRGSVNALVDLALSPDGRWLASVHAPAGRGRCGDEIGTPAGGGVFVWEAATGRLVRRLDVRTWGGLAVSPDGRVLAAAIVRDDGTADGVRFWDAAGGPELVDRRLPGGDAVAFSADGRYLAVGGPEVRLVEIASGQVVRTFRAGSEVRGLTFTRDGRRVVSGHDDGTALVWDAAPEPAAAGRTPWDDLASADAGAAWRAGGALAADAGAVRLIASRLRPAARPAGKATAELVADLGAAEYTVREAATRELVTRVETDGPDLEAERLRTPSPEVCDRLDTILRRGRPRPWPRLDRELLRTVRAVEVLEQVGSPEAVAALRDLAKGTPGARLTREAEAALRRLNKVP